MDEFAVLMQTVTEWAWIGWLVLIAVFLVIEMLTLDFTFLMLALGGTVGLLTGLVGAPIWLQVIVAAFAAAVFILLIRPPLLKRLHRGEDPAKSNIDALIDLRGIALEDITQVSGQVRLSNGDTWTARSMSGYPLPAGSAVIVTQISGATALVRPATQ